MKARVEKLDRELNEAGKSVANKTLAELKAGSLKPASSGGKPLAPKP